MLFTPIEKPTNFYVKIEKGDNFMKEIKYQMNLTLDNDTVLKAFETNVTSETLTLKFLASDITKSELIDIFTPAHKDNFKAIYKTTIAGRYVTTFSNYIKVVSITESVENIALDVEKEIATTDEEGNTITAIVIETVDTPTNIVIVTLNYVSPTEQKMDEIAAIVKPTVDVETCTLEELQDYVQTQNKVALANYLERNPLEWTDGEFYGVTQEDQIEMLTDLNAYNLKIQVDPTWKLEWHNIKKACREFTLEEFSLLLSAIIDYVYPLRRKQETFKQAIYDATTKEAVLAVNINYAE